MKSFRNSFYVCWLELRKPLTTGGTGVHGEAFGLELRKTSTTGGTGITEKLHHAAGSFVGRWKVAAYRPISLVLATTKLRSRAS